MAQTINSALWEVVCQRSRTVRTLQPSKVVAGSQSQPESMERNSGPFSAWHAGSLAKLCIVVTRGRVFLKDTCLSFADCQCGNSHTFRRPDCTQTARFLAKTVQFAAQFQTHSCLQWFWKFAVQLSALEIWPSSILHVRWRQWRCRTRRAGQGYSADAHEELMREGRVGGLGQLSGFGMDRAGLVDLALKFHCCISYKVWCRLQVFVAAGVVGVPSCSTT
eukprot:1312142-Amphidinium_carterae.1